MPASVKIIVVVAPIGTKDPFRPLAIGTGTNVHFILGSDTSWDKYKESNTLFVVVISEMTSIWKLKCRELSFHHCIRGRLTSSLYLENFIIVEMTCGELQQ